MEKTWKESELLCYPSGTAYENGKFRVACYEFFHHNGYTEKVPLYWRAYRLSDGNYVKDEMFKTAEDAMAVCL